VAPRIAGPAPQFLGHVRSAVERDDFRLVFSQEHHVVFRLNDLYVVVVEARCNWSAAPKRQRSAAEKSSGPSFVPLQRCGEQRRRRRSAFASVSAAKISSGPGTRRTLRPGFGTLPFSG